MEDMIKRIEFKDPEPKYIDVTSDAVVAASIVETRVDCLVTEKVCIYMLSLNF